MLEAVEATARGEVHCSPKIAGSLFRRIAALSTDRACGSAPNALTAREIANTAPAAAGACPTR